MQTSIAHAAAINRIRSGGSPEAASSAITVNATMAPTMTTSPCAKLMSWMIP